MEEFQTAFKTKRAVKVCSFTARSLWLNQLADQYVHDLFQVPNPVMESESCRGLILLQLLLHIVDHLEVEDKFTILPALEIVYAQFLSAF